MNSLVDVAPLGFPRIGVPRFQRQSRVRGSDFAIQLSSNASGRGSMTKLEKIGAAKSALQIFEEMPADTRSQIVESFFDRLAASPDPEIQAALAELISACEKGWPDEEEQLSKRLILLGVAMGIGASI
jgi:hypothetical protein